MAPVRTGPSTGLLRCVLAGLWSVVFAVPHFYWALGGRAGLGGQATAADVALQESWFAAYNLLAGFLGILGAVVALLLALDWASQGLRRWLLIAAVTGCVLLLVRGALGLTLLALSRLDGSADEETPAVLIAIEPWFLLGGLAFGGMVLSQRRRSAGRRIPPGAGTLLPREPDRHVADC